MYYSGDIIIVFCAFLCLRHTIIIITLMFWCFMAFLGVKTIINWGWDNGIFLVPSCNSSIL